MDYFTKWVKAVPLPDQKATSITKAIITLGSSFGIPDVIHSDQGRNFESCLFREMLTAFGIEKSRTMHTTRKVMAWLNVSTDHFYSYFVAMFNRKMIGNSICYGCYMHTAQPCTRQQVFPLFNLCLADHPSLRRFRTSLVLIQVPIQLSYKPS